MNENTNKKPKGFWKIKENCAIEAKKYSNRKAFEQGSTVANRSCRENGWLDELCQHMVRPDNYNFIWTYEKCLEQSLKYKFRSEFQKNSHSAYNSAKNNSWLDLVCKHMEISGDRKHRCIYAQEFPDNSVYVGLTYNMKARQHTREHSDNDTVKKYTEKTGLIPIVKQLTEFLPLEKAVFQEGYYVEKYKNNGWIILNKIKTGGVGGNILKWDFETCKLKMKTCSSKSEFKSKYPSAYGSARKNKWLNLLFEGIENLRKPANYWNNYSNCKIESLKYLDRSLFKKISPVCYRSILKNKWFELLEHLFKKTIYFWTKNEVVAEYNKYRDKSEFRKNSPSAYNAACKKGWLGELPSYI